MPNSLRGQFLVAGPGLKDPNFYQSVVLMMEHTPDGIDAAVHQTLAHGGTPFVVSHSRDLDPVGGIGAILRF